MGNGIQVVLRIDPGVLDLARRRAAKAGLTVSGYIRQLIAHDLELLGPSARQPQASPAPVGPVAVRFPSDRR